MIGIHKYFHWLYYSRKRRHLFILGSGLFFWLFLGVTQPFGIYNSNVSDIVLFFILLPLGIFWSLNLYIVDLIAFRLLKSSPDKIIKSDLILWIIKLVSFIHLIFILRGFLCDWQCVDAFEYLQLWFAVPIMFGFCYFPFALYARSIFFQDIVVDGTNTDSALTITGSGNEKLHFKITEVVYLKSDDNYVDIFLLDSVGGKSKVSVRSTLKMLEETLGEYSQFIRIHRSYMINIGFFTTFSKGNNILSITYGETPVELPVSRKYKAHVSNLFDYPK